MDQSNVKKGLPLLLRCEASGTPTPRIEWQAPNGDIYRMMKDDFEGSFSRTGALEQVRRGWHKILPD